MNSYFCRNVLLISVPLKGIDIKMASPCKALNFGQNIFLSTEYVASWNIAQTWLLARLFSYSYLSSFISKILDLLYWIVSIFIFDGVTVKTENSLQPNFTNIIWWTPGQRENSKMLHVMQILNGMGVLLLSHWDFLLSKTKNLPGFFFFNFKRPELSNLFAPVIKHLIPWLSYSAKSSMSCWVTYMINSCPVCDMARRSFLLNCMSTVLIFPCHE